MGNFLSRVTAARRRLKNIADVFEGRIPRVLILGLDGAAVVFVVDGGDRVRADEARFELHELLQNGRLRRVPLVVVNNKQDVEGAMAEEEMRTVLDLATIQDRDVSLHNVSAVNGTNVKPVLTDVVDKIKAFRHYKSGLGVTGKAETPGSSKTGSDIGKDKDSMKFSSIEDADNNDNVPSLFGNLSKSEPTTDLDAVSDVVPGPSTYQPDQPLYAGHSGQPTASEVSSDVSSDHKPSYDSESYNVQNPDGVLIQPVDGNIVANEGTENTGRSEETSSEHDSQSHADIASHLDTNINEFNSSEAEDISTEDANSNTVNAYEASESESVSERFDEPEQKSAKVVVDEASVVDGESTSISEDSDSSDGDSECVRGLEDIARQHAVAV
ncbi:ARL3-like protein [Mya arenaria]|uniref:ARL3-like protein n=1 Tax=Mya arenaria TaxID=6604 RepID=A0ABY7EDC6_MYAAR|nr:ARL3-like protein [Mya arenaria]